MEKASKLASGLCAAGLVALLSGAGALMQAQPALAESQAPQTTGAPQVSVVQIVDEETLADGLLAPLGQAALTLHATPPDQAGQSAQNLAAAATPTAAEGAEDATRVNPDTESADSNEPIERKAAGSLDVSAQDQAAASTPTAAEGVEEPVEAAK